MSVASLEFLKATGCILMLSSCALGQPAPKVAGERLPGGPGGEGSGAVEFKLDVRPFTPRPGLSNALFVWVDGTGGVEVVDYSPHRLQVLGIRRGVLPEATTRRLSDHARSAGLGSPAPGAESTDRLLKEGDPFTLAVRSGREAVATRSGIVQETPAAIRQFIEDLQGLRQPLAFARPAAAYFRSEPIAAERLQRLEAGGKVRLLQVSEFPAETRLLLLAALPEPLVFFSLNPEQYQQLLARTSHGRDLFVVERSKGHQLTLFQTESQQPPTK